MGEFLNTFWPRRPDGAPAHGQDETSGHYSAGFAHVIDAHSIVVSPAALTLGAGSHNPSCGTGLSGGGANTPPPDKCCLRDHSPITPPSFLVIATTAERGRTVAAGVPV